MAEARVDLAHHPRVRTGVFDPSHLGGDQSDLGALVFPQSAPLGVPKEEIILNLAATPRQRKFAEISSEESASQEGANTSTQEYAQHSSLRATAASTATSATSLIDD